MIVWRCLYAEMLKLKRTLAVWMIIVVPLAMVGMMSLGSLLRGIQETGGRPWEAFTSLVVSLWSVLMLPLMVALQMALLSGLESTEKQWKHLFALPVPRAAIYLSKLILGIGMTGLSSLVLWGATLIAGLVLGWLRPDLGFDTALPWIPLLRAVGGAYLATWLSLAIQLWVSLRWQSFTLSIGVGMTATVIGVFLANSAQVAQWYPWTLSYLTTSSAASLATQVVLFGVCGGFVAGALGCWDIVRRDVL